MNLNESWRIASSKSNIIKYLALILVMGMPACGYEEKTTKYPTADLGQGNEQPQILAPEVFIVTKPNEINTFNIRQYYVGKGIFIDSMSSENENCRVTLSDDDINTVELFSNSAEFCTYSISVGNSENNEQTQTSLTSFSSMANKPILSTQLVLLKEDEIFENNSIDLKSVLGKQWPQGYELTAVSIEQSNKREAALWTENGIELSYAQVNDMTTLRYVLSNKGLESKPYTGLVVVGKGVEKTYAKISPISYNLNNVFTAKTQQQLNINIDTLPGLTIDINSQWQLAYVYSNTAIVTLTDKDSVENKSFTFFALAPGVHSINYVIQDQYNNILTASMSITVSANEKAVDWSFVEYYYAQTNTTKRFSAPLLFSEASELTNTKAIWDSNKATTLSGYLNADSAETICATKGRVPFAYELEQVYQADFLGNLDISKWPKSTPYMVYSEDKSKIQAYDLNTGALRDKSKDDEVLYLTCLEFQELMVLTTGVTFTVHDEAQVAVVTKKAQDSEYEIAIVSDEISDSDMTLRSEPINDHQFAVYVRSTKGGLFNLKITDVDNPEVTVESKTQAIVGKWQELQFSDDYTCRGSEGVRNPCYVIADETDILEIDIRMVDNEGNGIPDKSFSVETDLALVSKPWSDWSDLRGATSFKVKTQVSTLNPGETEKVVPADLKKDKGRKTINIKVIAPTQ